MSGARKAAESTDKAKAAAHYTAQAALAELALLKGKLEKPQIGAQHAWLPLGEASVLVEYEVLPGQDGGRDDPSIQPDISLLQVFIQGRWTDPEDILSAHVLDAWREELLEVEVAA